MKIGVIAAIAGELAPLVRQPGWVARTVEGLRVHQGVLALAGGRQAQMFACAGGIGAGPAARAVAAVRAAAAATAGVHGLDAWVSCGWAGALTCGVKPPEAYVATEVIDTRTGERWPTATPHAGPGALRIATLDHIALPHEKRPLAERYQAVLVDMEGATVARLAAAHNEPFFAIKAISDGYTDALPDLNRFLTPQGTMRTAALVAYSFARPWHLRNLARLGRQSSAASKRLAQGLPACFERTGLVS